MPHEKTGNKQSSTNMETIARHTLKNLTTERKNIATQKSYKLAACPSDRQRQVVFALITPSFQIRKLYDLLHFLEQLGATIASTGCQQLHLLQSFCTFVTTCAFSRVW